MPSSLKVPRGCGFVVTELGRSAAASVETCDCVYRPRGAYLVCDHCGGAAVNLSETMSITWNPSRKRD
jgi:hypothetical protein